MTWQDEWRERKISEEAWPIVNPNPKWEITRIHRLTAWENRPGYKKFYLKVFDETDNLLSGIKIRIDTEPSEGIVYDHPNLWGVTGSKKGNLGYLEWDSLGVPTWYVLFMEDEITSLIERIRTDLGNEYPAPPGSSQASSWRPINRPGIYSYDINIRRIL